MSYSAFKKDSSTIASWVGPTTQGMGFKDWLLLKLSFFSYHLSFEKEGKGVSKNPHAIWQLFYFVSSYTALLHLDDIITEKG